MPLYNHRAHTHTHTTEPPVYIKPARQQRYVTSHIRMLIFSKFMS